VVHFAQRKPFLSSFTFRKPGILIFNVHHNVLEFIKENTYAVLMVYLRRVTPGRAVPKLLIPLGVDAEGRPVSCTCWGKAVPRAHLYDDEFAKSWDLEFMYKVQRLVWTLHGDASLGLQPTEALLNSDVFEPSSKL